MRTFAELAVLSAANLFLIHFLGALPVHAACAALVLTMAVNCSYTRVRGGAAGFAAMALTAFCLWELSYIVEYAFYLGSAGAWAWAAITAAGLAASYLDSNPYVFFASLLCGLNLILNVYFEVLNVNPLSPEFLRLPESSHMAAVLLPVLLLALYHRAEGRRHFSNSALVVFMIGLALFVFLRNMELDAISGTYAGGGFLAAFALYYLIPAAEKSAAPAAGDEGAGIFSSLVVPCFTVESAPFVAQLILVGGALFLPLYGYFASRAAFELELTARGAALYTDDALGYVARFRIPLEAVLLSRGAEDQKRLKNLKNVSLYARDGWRVCPPGEVPEGARPFITASLRDVAQVPGGGAAALMDFSCASLVVPAGRETSISQAFVYRLKIGVGARGDNFLKSYELLGDKFVMFDDETVYNRFKTEVKNFFAVSGTGMAAIYDFAGRLRIVGPDSPATSMILADLAAMRSVAAEPGGGFLILTARDLMVADPRDRSVRKIDAADPGTAGVNIDMAAWDGGALVVGSEGCRALDRDGGNYVCRPVATGTRPGLSCAYFDGKVAVWTDYFSGNVTFAEYAKKDGAYAETRRREAAVGNAVFTRAALTSEKTLAAASYRESDSTFEIVELELGSFEIRRRLVIKNSTGMQVDDFAFSGGGIAITAAAGTAIAEFRHGFFEDPVRIVPLPGYMNEYRPPSPVKITVKKGVVRLLRDNAYFVYDPAKSSVERFECAR